MGQKRVLGGGYWEKIKRVYQWLRGKTPSTPVPQYAKTDSLCVRVGTHTLAHEAKF